jgi:hypothetical protein
MGENKSLEPKTENGFLCIIGELATIVYFEGLTET